MGAAVGKRFIYIMTSYSELSKTGGYRLLRIAKERLVQVKDRLVHVTLVDVSNVSFHRFFCAVLGKQRAHLG